MMCHELRKEKLRD